MSAPRKPALGRGLGALLSSAAAGASLGGEAPRLVEVELDRIRPMPGQPRTHFEDEALAELARSIGEQGVLQPVVVRTLEPHERAEATPGAVTAEYELIVGERRWRASRMAGRDTIPAVVREANAERAFAWALVENLQRADLNPLEIARAYRRMLDEFGLTQEALAESVGRTRTHVTHMLRLLNLAAPTLEIVARGELAFGHARALVGVTDAERQYRLARWAVATSASVRALEDCIALGRDVSDAVSLPGVPGSATSSDAGTSADGRSGEAVNAITPNGAASSTSAPADPSLSATPPADATAEETDEGMADNEDLGEETGGAVDSAIDGLRRMKTPEPDPQIRFVTDKLRAKLGAPVLLRHSKRGRGRIVIPYGDLDDLDRILRTLGYGVDA